MQNKLVENWLTNAKEITFTLPFVQLLISEGYTVIQSKGGQIEQGKDVIAISPDGKICCYQLKCGDIGSTEWTSIRGQIDDLTEIPPINPALKEEPEEWECFLVTNGDIKGPTARTITDVSKRKKLAGKMPIQTLSKEALLTRFQTKFGHFLPTEPEDVRVFFQMYCENGDYELDKKEFKQYFENFFASRESSPKQKKIEAIYASTILCSYLLTYKYSKENRIALVDAWTAHLFTIMYYADKWKIPKKKIDEIEKLILAEIEQQLTLLLEDVAEDKKSLVVGEYGMFSEPLLTYRIRCSQLLGYITGYILYMHLQGRVSELKNPKGFVENLILMNQHKQVAGEVMIPYPVIAAVLTTLEGAQKLASVELRSIMNGILANNTDDSDMGLPSAYYTLEETIAYYMELDNEISESFKGRSYTMWSVVMLLAKLGEREYLNENWVEISKITTQLFVPDKLNDLLLWNVDDGEIVDKFPAITQRWALLKEESEKSYDHEVPPILRNKKYLIPLMFLAMPHRLSPSLVLTLFSK